MAVGEKSGQPSLLSHWVETPRTEPNRSLPEGIDVGVALVAAQYLLADHLTSLEDDVERRAKMRRVVDRQRADLGRLEVDDACKVVASVVRRLEPEEQIGFFVELYFIDPFAPYSLKTSPRNRRNALALLATALGQDPELIGKIGQAATSARKAHLNVSWAKVGMIGVGSAVLFGLGGYLAAPLIGATIGSAAGLSGAAATNFGLALLGGGSLAAGGAGMAGGMWLVASSGAALGAVAGAGGRMLFEIGSARARHELLKLQVTYKLTVIDTQVGQIKAQEMLQELHGELEQLRRMLEEERTLNETNARRVKQLEATVDSLEAAIRWMDEQSAAT